MRKLTLSLAVMAALLPARGYPLGLGDLELNSALNQELNADIEVISASTEDANQILVKLADREAFSRAGMDRPFLLQQLKFKIIQKNGKSFVHVFTKKPVREPFLSFLLEIDWPQGHLLREYTLLLDPPVYNTGVSSAPAASTGSDHPFIDPADTRAQAQSGFSGQQSGQNAQAPATYQSAPVAQGTQSGVISSDSGRSVTYQYQAAPQGTSTPGQYRVKQHDTLWSIASRMRPDNSVSIEQMMLALARKNPEAFIQENINGVKRGYILRTPSRDEINQIDRQQAVAQAREHGALWREYSQGAYSSSPASSLEADAPSGSSAADQPRDADGHLSIVSADEDQGSEYAGSNQDQNAELARLKQDLALAREQLESEKLEKEDLRSRLSSLEDRVKRVIEMDDGELAELQKDLQESQQFAEPAVEPTEEVIDVEEPLEEMVTEEPAEELPEEPVQAIDDEVSEEPATDTMAEEQPADDAVFVDESETAGAVEEEGAAPAPSVAESVKAVEPPAFAQKKPRGFLDSLMEDPALIGMVTGGLAFLFLLIALLLKKLRGGKSEEDEWAAAYETDSADEAKAAGFELEPGATVKNDALVDMETTAEMMAASLEDTTRVKPREDKLQDNQELQDALLNLDTGDADSPKDDVLAEADVYIAYGIYQQAEELLKNAIDQNPDRDDYRMKLLETHYAAKNATEFEQVAQQVQPRKGNDSEFWGRVVAMGSELSPGNSLYTAAAPMIDQPDTELDLPADDMQTTDLDLGLDDDSGFNASLTLSEPVDTSELQLGAEEESLDMGDLGGDLGDDLAATDDLSEELDLGMDLENDLANITSEFEAVESEPPAEQGAPVEEDSGADLEFDLGELDDGMGDVESEVALGGAGDLDIDDDFSLDFDAADLGFEESEEESSASSDEIPMDADLDLGVDLDDAFSAEDASGEVDMSADLGDIDLGEADMGLDESDAGELDLGDMDLGDMELDETPAAETESLDLSDDSAIDLSAGDGDFDISELSEDVDEVSTKLDLARAYIDMGDKDGARSILDEVKIEGNNEQQQEAEALLQQAS